MTGSFSDFVEWAGGTRRAALQLNLSPSRVSRLKLGRQPLTADVAERCEQVSRGLFKKERVMWPDGKAA
jgi:DNA-binding transcriptional regulator YdaS (Cro superfamily)